MLQYLVIIGLGLGPVSCNDLFGSTSKVTTSYLSVIYNTGLRLWFGLVFLYVSVGWLVGDVTYVSANCLSYVIIIEYKNKKLS